MCGILGVYAGKMSFEIISNLYQIFLKQQSRGVQGGGLLIRTPQKIGRFRSKDPFKIFSGACVNLWNEATDNSIILFHHRFPTSTKNKWHCNHPITNEDKTHYIIHNGHLSGEFTFEKEHKFETQDGKDFTDSEIAVHLLDEFLADSQRTEALIKLSEKLGHGFTAAIVFKDEPRIYLIKNGYPVKVCASAGNTYFSSEIHDDKYQIVKELKDGEVGYIDSNGYTMLKEGKETSYPTYGGYYSSWTDSDWAAAYSRKLSDYREPKPDKLFQQLAGA